MQIAKQEYLSDRLLVKFYILMSYFRAVEISNPSLHEHFSLSFFKKLLAVNAVTGEGEIPREIQCVQQMVAYLLGKG